MTATVLVRKPVEVNTDPQRRCYDGCHFSSRVDWSEWAPVCTYASRETAEGAVEVFRNINPQREYRIEED